MYDVRCEEAALQTQDCAPDLSGKSPSILSSCTKTMKIPREILIESK